MGDQNWFQKNPVASAGLIGAGISVAGAVVGGIMAANTAKKSRKKQFDLEQELETLRNNRQEIVNPYEDIKDLSGMLTNQFDNLGVATQAAEMQVEQADISLANTLDTLRATGASAGGATALAQAALQSKKGVSASIEQQEAQNEKLRAQGEQQLNQQKMAEAQRIQGAEAAGKEFVYGQQENRELMQLDRAQNQADNAAAQEAQSRADTMAALTGTIGGIASTAGSAYAAGAFGEKPLSGSGINKAYDPIDFSSIERITGKKL